ncbi:MAG: ribonuclease R [Rhodospirillaceae bacterium]|nr:ribonuclease R [Rhodospirillaceae bacterium]
MARPPARPHARTQAKGSHSLPSKQQIIEFVESSPDPVGRREIARAFNIKGAARMALKKLLREMEAGGEIAPRRQRQAAANQLPSVTVVTVVDLDSEMGEAVAEPATWTGTDPMPRITLPWDNRPGRGLGIGDRALVRIRQNDDNEYTGEVMRRIDAAPERMLGVYERERHGGKVHPTDRRARHDLVVASGDDGGAQSGDLVLVEPLKRDRLGLRRARVVERIGGIDDPGAISLLAIQENDIPTVFPSQALALAEAAGPVDLGEREDLRETPLVTIDGADARDFDDAVWAATDDDPENPGGWRVLVAIADVAHYVRPNNALDREALERGNSVYFPDRVVPMLPEALSNGLCSLRPNEERACMAVEFVLTAEGRKRSHRFLRGLMRSAARLTYEQVQMARDGADPGVTVPDGVLEPLYGAYEALKIAREHRGALDLDLPERTVELDDEGHVLAISPRARLDSHKLIEELMVQANVCAAETLERRRTACMYRVHESPDPEKVTRLREFLASLDMKFGQNEVIRPKTFNRLLGQVRETPNERLVNELVLRCQSQALYAPDNIGHFGLGLARYAHFTSPIRRYADLLVHRALIAAHNFGDDGLSKDAGSRFVEFAEQISMTERRAVVAERMAMDRYATRYLADRVGSDFTGRITGVASAGVFVAIADTGADGLVGMRNLPSDYYEIDEALHQLRGTTSGLTFGIGDEIEVRLIAADIATGRLTLDYLSGGKITESGGRRGRGRARNSREPSRQKRGRSRRR